MRVLVLLTSRRKKLRPDTLSSKIPNEAKNFPGVEIVLAAHPQGAGANQKVGFRYAIENGFDAVAVFPARTLPLLRYLPQMASLLEQNAPAAGVVAATRRGPVSALLSGLLNCLAGTRLQGWTSGIRLYRSSALKEIAFDLNASDDVFGIEVLLQLLYHGQVFETMRLDGFGQRPRAVWSSLKAALKYRLQKFNLFYDVRYHPDVLSDKPSSHPLVYNEKPDVVSPHSIVATDEELLVRGSKVLDIGCATGYMGKWLRDAKGCLVTGVDVLPAEQIKDGLEAYYQIDVEAERDTFLNLVRSENFEAILALDVVEHMVNPERFLWELSQATTPPTRFIVSTGNVAFFAVRLMLFLGHFNYGQKGILDITHKRLFSYHTFKNLLEQTGFTIEEERYCPLPFSELGLPRGLARFLEGINRLLILIRPRFFAYQVMFAASPLASPQTTFVKIQ